MGGSTAIRVALREPRRVERLVLLGSGLHGFKATTPPSSLQLDLSSAWERRDFVRILDLTEKTWAVGAERGRDSVDPGFLALVRAMNRKALDHLDVEREPLDHQTSDVDAISRLSIPVLLVIGAYDTPQVREAAEYIAERVPGARLVRMPDTARLPSLERPEAFEAQFEQWLHKTAAAAP